MKDRAHVWCAQAIRSLLQQHVEHPLPPPPPRPAIRAYGHVQLTSSAVFLDNVQVLAPGSGLAVDVPEIMEEYGQRCDVVGCFVHPCGTLVLFDPLTPAPRWGFVLYRAMLPAADGWTLDLQSPVHDYAHVLVNGQVVATLDRSTGQTSLQLPAVGVSDSGNAVLDILVQVRGCVAIQRHENRSAHRPWATKTLAVGHGTARA